MNVYCIFYFIFFFFLYLYLFCLRLITEFRFPKATHFEEHHTKYTVCVMLIHEGI